MKAPSLHPRAIEARKRRAKDLEKSRTYSRIYRAKSRAKNPEKFRAYYRVYRAKSRATDPGGYRDRERAYYRKWRKENPDMSRAKSYRSHLKKYGMNLAQYDALLIGQSGRCALCGQALILGGLKNLSAVVDHDHASGKVRAILCAGCNRGLGHFEDDPDRCEMAAAYLRKHQPDFKSPAPASSGADPTPGKAPK